MSPEVTAAIIAGGVGIVTVIATVVVQIVGFRSTKANTEQQIKATHKDTADTLGHQREQLDRTLAEQRTRTLNERFATAAEQLGSDKPAVRLAGVYAMAGLADDWEENRQTCVNVLCAYLRMPYGPDPGQDAPEPQQLAFQAIREVRHAVIGVITAHLKEEAAVSWRGLNFDFTGVVFDGGNFGGAWFSGGEVKFCGAWFSGGMVSFDLVRFSGGTVDFHQARFSGGMVSFNVAQFFGGEVRFGFAEFSGSTVLFAFSPFASGTVDFNNAQFSGGEVVFDGAHFSGSEVRFNDALFSGGAVRFGLVDLGGVDFRATEFSGGTVDFKGAKFSGGTVDFRGPPDWSSPPAFPWTDTPPPGVELP
jgi:uncharacterized protein YjbI with pentapeptide repeats